MSDSISESPAPATDIPAAVVEQTPEPDAATLQNVLARLRAQQNLPLAILGGFVAAVAGALVWALVTAESSFQIGWMAVGIAFVVGFTVRKLGRGIDRRFGVAGAALSLLGCLAGNLGAVMVATAKTGAVSAGTMLAAFAANPGLAVEALRDSFNVMDLLFYGIAIYFGYKYSFHRPAQAEIEALL